MSIHHSIKGAECSCHQSAQLLAPETCVEHSTEELKLHQRGNQRKLAGIS